MIPGRIAIIAEAGVNHDGDLDSALALVDGAADAGADIVKFQTFRADKVAAGIATQADYQARNTGKVESQLDMLRRLELTHDMHLAIARRCKERNIEFLSTAFDPEMLNYLVAELGIKRIKIPSGEATNPLLLAAAATKNLPVLLSTGMCTMPDILEALGTLAFYALNGIDARGTRAEVCNTLRDLPAREWLKKSVTVLHCTSEYPTPLSDANLAAIGTLRNALDLPVGYSDHTLGFTAPLGAVALGATVIEKHVTLDCSREGPDHKASLAIAELPSLVAVLHDMHAALGTGIKEPTAAESKTRRIVRRGLFAKRDLTAGSVLSAEDIELLRPETTLDARDLWSVVGHALRSPIRAGEAIDLES